MIRSREIPLGLSMFSARFFTFLWVLLCLAGCASYSTKINEPRMLLETGNYAEAISQFEALAKEGDNDELLYVMDLGIAYFRAGQLEKSIETLRRADALAEIKDYTSLTQEAASILVSDDVKPYKGEDFEKVLINVYLAMAYTMMGNWEGALVECRKVNHKIDLMISEGKLPYKRNYFAKYLAGVLFEAEGELNDAFVDYRQLLKWSGPNLPYLDIPLLRLASKLQAEQEFQQYEKEFGKNVPYKLGKNYGEIVLLVEQGRSPIKVPHPNFRLLPKFQKRSYGSRSVSIRDEKGTFKAESKTLFDIEATAIEQLDHRIGLITTKKIAGVVLKEVVAHQVAKHTKSKLMGALTSLILHASDRADLRSWTTLPARLQLARVRVPAGRHDVVLDMVRSNGIISNGIHRWEGVEILPGKIHFLRYRTGD